MAKRRISKGRCYFCNAIFSKNVMTKHLKKCEQRKAEIEKQQKEIKIFHIMAEGRYLPQYWIHFEMPANATLKDLDNFLRDIWVECCGHLSAFTIDNIRYSSYPLKEYDERSMKEKLEEVLYLGMKFYYEYDFGTPTELVLKILDERKGKMKEKVKLLARNEPPPIKCEICGKTATYVCSQCIYEGKGWLCDECASKHECGEEMLLPVVNSPRVGTCGYTG